MKKTSLSIAAIAAIAHATFGDGWQYNSWTGLEVDGGQPANWASLAFNSPVETWSIAYRRSGYLRLAEYFGGGGYYVWNVAAGGQGASLAYSPNGIASMSHVASGRLMVVMRAGTSWNSVQVDPKDVGAFDTCIAYDTLDRACVSYCKINKSAGLWFARQNGPRWITERVDNTRGSIYNQSTIDAAGNIGIAYSADLNGDSVLDGLKYARFNGVTWEIWTLDTVASAFVSTAIDQGGNPVVACTSGANNELRLYRSTNGGWSASEIVDATTPALNCAVGVGSDGVVWVTYATPTNMRAARRDPVSGVWAIEEFEPTSPGSSRNSLKIHSDGRPRTAYGAGPAFGYTESVHLAVKLAQ